MTPLEHPKNKNQEAGSLRSLVTFLWKSSVKRRGKHLRASEENRWNGIREKGGKKNRPKKITTQREKEKKEKRLT